jgi:hypothetical protein
MRKTVRVFLETEDKMSVGQISDVKNGYANQTPAKASQVKNAEKADHRNAEDTAAVYEKSSSGKEKVYQRDNATISRLMEEAERREKNIRELVEKMLRKQGETFNASTDVYSLLREGKVSVDPETRAQAEKDIAEDGYWGVKQTSDRLVSFAKALTGGDPAKADSMIDAVKKGFEEATKAWGGELPGICKNTMDETISKLEEWRESIKKDTAMSEASEDAFKNQAAAAQTAK